MTQRAFAPLALVLALTLPAQGGISNFEDSGLSASNSYFNAAPNQTDPSFGVTTHLSGSFVSGGASFSNNYNYTVDPRYGNYSSWSGWSISNQAVSPTYVNQQMTPDYHYQYTSITGSGANNSATYAVANTEGNGQSPVSIVNLNLASGEIPLSLQLTNTAYDYYAMKYGDGFATAFTTGNYFKVLIYGYTGVNGTGTEVGGAPIEYYLGDYRSSDPTQQYLVDSWKTVDLTSLAGAQSLVFGVDTNDYNYPFGQSGGAYVALPYEFALDNLTTGPAVVPEPSSLVLCLIGAGPLLIRVARSRRRPLSQRGPR
jgi:hypothetical protein